MAAPHTEITIPGPRPDCDLCKGPFGSTSTPAEYDGATRMGAWAYMCKRHFESHGVGLGLGRGQRLIVEGESGEAS